jgi:hypothetical protein
MALPTGFRPRSKTERLKMAQLLAQAPLRVALELVDDGWAAACLRVAGRVPIWRGMGERRPIESVLIRLGLPGLEVGEADGKLLPGLVLQRTGPIDSAPLPACSGPLVSILICTHNRKNLVLQAIASALAQSWPREVLVIDDGSTDGTATRLAGMPGIRFFRQARNGGKSRALNRGLEEAKGSAVLVLDDDDLLLPGALQVMAGGLFANPDLVAVYSDTIFFDGKTGQVRRVFACSRAPGTMARRVVVKQIPGTTGATLVRMSAQREVGSYEPSLIRGEDMDMFLRLAHLGPIEGIPIPTFLARSHDGLRGRAGAQWRKTTRVAEEKRALKFIRPIYRQRWTEYSPGAHRTESHAWGIGLAIRGLLPEARQELLRWPGPYTPYEAWARTQCQIPTTAELTNCTLVVVDNGDPGSLEKLLAAQAGPMALWVCLEVPRDPLDSLKIHWPGNYGAKERLHCWVHPTGPVHLRITSDPGWRPPPLADLSVLPDLPAPEALHAICAVQGWKPPTAWRPGYRRSPSPLAEAVGKARKRLNRRRDSSALGHAGDAIALAPTWGGGWKMAAEAFMGMGRIEQGEFCARQADRLSATARGIHPELRAA